MGKALLLVVVALLSGTGCAKKDCEVPEMLPRPVLEGATLDEPRRVLPIGGYSLALSWTPQHCASRMTNPRDQLQCDGKAGRFGFILHGLWPEGEGRLWPQYCAPARLVPETVIREQFCTTPSVQLIQHEWEKHGTCMAKTPDEYFSRGRGLYSDIRFPEMEDFSGKSVTVAAFKQAFAAANKDMRPDHLRIDVSRDGWLEEVLVCLDKDFKRQACPASQRDAPDDRIIKIR